MIIKKNWKIDIKKIIIVLKKFIKNIFLNIIQHNNEFLNFKVNKVFAEYNYN